METKHRAIPRTTARLCATLLLLVAFPASPGARQKDAGHATHKGTHLPAVIWRDPGDAASLNLFYGAGGQEHEPDLKGTFTFVKEDMQATSPKFDVRDGRGVHWKVKLGEEPESETAASRFLWAAGYFVDEDYYVAALRVKGLPKLHRGQNFVKNGVVHNARLERSSKTVKKVGQWDWFNNPFTGQRELNGLRVMMSLLNNWDLAETNNAIDETSGERRYVVADLGATFGNTGNSLTRSKSEPGDYAESTFIEHSSPTSIDFVLHSRPFILSAVNVANYRDRTHMEQVTKHIPRDDARWLGRRLSMLSAAQIRDGFRAGGYRRQDVETYTRAMQKRIAELGAL